MSIFVKFWLFFTMPAYQMWSCHLTQEANFEKVLFFPNSVFNIRKGYKISSRKALYFRSYQPTTSQGGGKHPRPRCTFQIFGRWQGRRTSQVPPSLPPPLIFKAKFKHFCHPTLLKIRFKITVTSPPPSQKMGKVKITVL